MSKFAVVLCCDKAYFPFALCVANSLSSHDDPRSYDIVIISEETPIFPNTVNISNLKFHHIANLDLSIDQATSARISRAAYYRIFAPDILSGYDRLLYLDSDIIAYAGVEQLFDLDLQGAPIAAVRDKAQWLNPRRKMVDLQKNGLSTSDYFNSGVLLVDVEAYSQECVRERALEILKNESYSLIQHDQTLLNIVCKDNWFEIGPEWNFQLKWQTRFLMNLVDFNIMHFTGPIKPWNPKAGAIHPIFSRYFFDFITKHFPELKKTYKLECLQSPDRWGVSLLYHFVHRKRALRYLKRFNTNL